MTVKDLLEKYLEYRYLWCLDHSINSKPAKIRLRRINSMLKAFGISKDNINPLVQMKYFVMGESKKLSRAQKLNNITDLQYFAQGEFLHDRETIDNQELIQRIQNLAKENVPTIYESKKNRISITWLFSDLMRFRQRIYEVATPWGGFDEGFELGLYYGKVHQEKLKTIIRSNTDEIDEILCLIIDPKKIEISEEELIEKFNYESADLKTIDREWRIENY